MAVGCVITANGRNVALDRLMNSTPASGAVVRFVPDSGTATPTKTDANPQFPLGSGYSFMAGYPQFDTVNSKVTTRNYISSTELNGGSLTECGLFWWTPTSGLFLRAVYNPIVKTSSDEIAYVLTFKFSA